MAIIPAVSYILYATSSREQSGNIITLSYFEEVNLLYESRKDMESGNKYDDYSTLAQLFSKE